VAGSDLPDISPEQASWGSAGYLADELLPALAANWLVDGYDSDELRELAGLSAQESRLSGRRLFGSVLASLGYPVPDRDSPFEELPWRGYWDQIEFAQREMDRRLTPYVAAQRVIEVAGDVPDLWVAAGGEQLMSLLRDWDKDPAVRRQIEEQIRGRIRLLRIDDVPPLITGG
jgi:hypothetical protein